MNETNLYYRKSFGSLSFKSAGPLGHTAADRVPVRKQLVPALRPVKTEETVTVKEVGEGGREGGGEEEGEREGERERRKERERGKEGERELSLIHISEPTRHS